MKEAQFYHRLKVLHGLKQDSRFWYHYFHNFFSSLSFLNTYAYPSLYIKTSGETITVIDLYVDDILLTENCQKMMEETIGDMEEK